MAASSSVLQSYLNELTEALEKPNGEHYNALLQRNSERKGGDFLIPLTFYLGIIDNTEFVSLPYLNAEQKANLERNLQITELLLIAQVEYEKAHQKIENSKKYITQLRRCVALNEALNNKQDELSDGKPVKYTAIYAAHDYAEAMVGVTKGIRDQMGALNSKRLYWVWGSVFLKTVISLVPEDFRNAGQAGTAIKTPDPYTGCLSWALYYFRFSLNLFLLLKHTIKGPWMSKEESKTPWTERFQTQWSARKFTLLNDSLWATANLVCFFWLTGKGVLGAWGDSLTIALLIFDITATLWTFEEQKAQYEKQIEQFDTDIGELAKNIAGQRKALEVAQAERDTNLALLKKELEMEHAKNPVNLDDIERLNTAIVEQEQQSKAAIAGEHSKKIKIKQMQMHLDAQMSAEKECMKDWEYKKIGLVNDIAYAVGLTLAFVLLTAPFMPLAAPTILIMGIVGAVLCFAFTVINNAISGGLDIYRARHSLKEMKAEHDTKIDLLNEMLKDPNLNENEKKLCYLEIMRLEAKTEDQRQKITYKSLQLVRAIMIEALLPALVFSALIFFPLGIGIAVLGAGLGLAIASHLLIDHFFKPKEDEEKKLGVPPVLPTLDEKKYNEYCSNAANRVKFFPPAPPKKSDVETEPLLGSDGSLSPSKS